MRWLVRGLMTASIALGGCSQTFEGIGMTTASLPTLDLPSLTGESAPVDATKGAAQPDQKAGAEQKTSAAKPSAQAYAPAPIPVKASAAPPAAPTAQTATLPSLLTFAAAGPAPAERISGNLFRVQADDRKIDDAVERENYTLLRAAETTKAHGGTHFVLVSAGDQASVGMPSLKTIMSGNREAEFGAYFRVLRIETDGTAPIGAMSASEIIHFFGPKFGRAPT